MSTALEKGIAIGKSNLFGNPRKQAEAIEYFKQALLENPQEIEAWMWISQLTDDSPTKRYCYQKVLEIEPNHPLAKQFLDFQNATEPGFTRKKISSLQTFFESHQQALPQSKAETSLQKGVAALKSGDKKSAMQFLKQAIDENPRDVNAWLWVSSLIDDPEKKKFCFQKVLAIEPQNKHALRGMATLDHSAQSSSSSLSATSEIHRPQVKESSSYQQSVPQSNKTSQYQVRPANVQIVKKKKRISVWAMLGLGLFLSYMILFPFSAAINSKELGEFAMMLGFGWGFHYIISGYIGAFKMIKNGQILQLVGCSILLGGLPLLLPAVLGYFLLWWANRAEKAK